MTGDEKGKKKRKGTFFEIDRWGRFIFVSLFGECNVVYKGFKEIHDRERTQLTFSIFKPKNSEKQSSVGIMADI